MADIEELKALVELADDSDHELITRLRGALKSKVDGVDSARVSELESKVARYEREALFDEAGIGDSPTAKLLRKALNGEEGLTVERIQAEAKEYGLISESENPVSVDEAQGLAAINSAAGEAPAIPPDIATRMAKVSSLEELEALEAEAGIAVEGGFGAINSY
jgi:hypothetical protein